MYSFSFLKKREEGLQFSGSFNVVHILIKKKKKTLDIHNG